MLAIQIVQQPSTIPTEGQSTRVRWNTVPSRKEQREAEDHPKTR